MENVKVNKNVSVRTRNLVTSALLAAIICLVTGIYFIFQRQTVDMLI